jgi:hypothetical protein
MNLFGAEQEAFTSDDYYTPPGLFQTLGLKFSLDVASPPGGVPWIPAADYYTMEDDGLTSPWHGRVWMNPPYSNPTPWVERFMDHRHGVALLPVTRSRWMEGVWTSDAAVVFTPSNFAFIRENRATSIMWAAVLVAFGDECVEAIARVGRVR